MTSRAKAYGERDKQPRREEKTAIFARMARAGYRTRIRGRTGDWRTHVNARTETADAMKCPEASAEHASQGKEALTRR